MIHARYMEVRSRKLPGQPPETIIRTVNAVNGHTRKTVRVLRGDRTVSHVTEPLTTKESSNIQIRRFTPDLYASVDARTMEKINGKRKTLKRATKRTRSSRRK